MVNASIEGDEIVYHAQENLGVAVDTERGLLVPVVRNAGDLNIAGLARQDRRPGRPDPHATRSRRTSSAAAPSRSPTPAAAARSSTPRSSTSRRSAILGTGAVVKRPVVVTDVDGGETIAIRSMVYLALTYDHRLVDGADAARFLVAVKQRLEEGAFDADLGV